MRVQVTPQRLSAPPGKAAVITITVTNTADIISGHDIRVLGVDPQWVQLDQSTLSLFPDASGTVVARVTLPAGIPAGTRRVDVEVAERTPPHDTALVPVELTVPAQVDLDLALDPVSVTGGRAVDVGVVADNSGNAPIDLDLAGKDEEGQVAFEFRSAPAVLEPGEQAVATAHLRARRPWFGSPKIRPFTIEAGSPSAPVIAHGAWVQNPRLSRGHLALLGLVAAATVFAVVIATTLTSLGHKSNQDLALALQVAAGASQGSGTGGTAGISGTVSQLSTQTPVGGITVTLYQASNITQPVVSTATGANGGYHFGGLAAGSYKVLFNGAGFAELWYPQSISAADATAVTVKTGQLVKNINIYLGGLPASLSGQVVGGDPTGAVLTLEVPPTTGESSGSGRLVPSGGAVTVPGVAAVVTTQTLDATGDFDLADVPSPAVYDLVVTKTGYATTTQEVSLTGGESRTGITLQLHLGDGSIAGTVETSSGGLGGATITVSADGTSVPTVSETTPGHVGDFSVSGLPTPASLTVVVSAPGFSDQTEDFPLGPDQQLKGLRITLTSGVGSISGVVTTPSGTPEGGVTVTASNGTLTKWTQTLSTGKHVGSYNLGGLPVPNDYTVTFSRPDLASQTRAEALTSAQPSATNVDASMVANTAALHGIVTQVGGAALGNVQVTVNSGTRSYLVTTASQAGPGGPAGSYSLGGILPGTYAVTFTRVGVLPIGTTINLVAGEDLLHDETLPAAASIDGVVVRQGTNVPLANAEVRLYLASQYPSVVTQSVLTDAKGRFEFADVEAPQFYIVGVTFPPGSPDALTIEVQTVPQQEVKACGNKATGAGTGPGTPTTTTTTTPQGQPSASPTSRDTSGPISAAAGASATPPAPAPSAAEVDAAACPPIQVNTG